MIQETIQVACYKPINHNPTEEEMLQDSTIMINVPAWTHNGLGVHRALDNKRSIWVIVHIETGMQIRTLRHCNGAKAQKVLQRVASLIDWTDAISTWPSDIGHQITKICEEESVA